MGRTQDLITPFQGGKIELQNFTNNKYVTKIAEYLEEQLKEGLFEGFMAILNLHPNGKYVTTILKICKILYDSMYIEDDFDLDNTLEKSINFTKGNLTETNSSGTVNQINSIIHTYMDNGKSRLWGNSNKYSDISATANIIIQSIGSKYYTRSFGPFPASWLRLNQEDYMKLIPTLMSEKN